MPRSAAIVALLMLWTGAYAGAFVFYHITPVAGDGFTAGLNRVGGFLGWQLLAGLISIWIWRFGRNFQAGSAMRWLTRLPVILFAVPTMILALVLAWAVMA